jgi:hypothetical protein
MVIAAIAMAPAEVRPTAAASRCGGRDPAIRNAIEVRFDRRRGKALGGGVSGRK